MSFDICSYFVDLMRSFRHGRLYTYTFCVFIIVKISNLSPKTLLFKSQAVNNKLQCWILLLCFYVYRTRLLWCSDIDVTVLLLFLTAFQISSATHDYTSIRLLCCCLATSLSWQQWRSVAMCGRLMYFVLSQCRLHSLPIYQLQVRKLHVCYAYIVWFWAYIGKTGTMQHWLRTVYAKHLSCWCSRCRQT